MSKTAQAKDSFEPYRKEQMETLRTNEIIFYILWWTFCLAEAAACKSNWSKSTVWLDPRWEAILPVFTSSFLNLIFYSMQSWATLHLA